MIQQSGMTLLEMLVALLLSVILMTGLTDLIVFFHHSQTKIEQQLVLQDQLRFLDFRLRRSIESAGFKSCQSSQSNAVKIYSSTNYPKFISGDIVAGSDVLLLSNINTASTIISGISTDKKELTISDNFNLSSGKIVFIADCQESEINQVIKVSNNQLILASPLKYNYSENTELGYEEKTAFYIAETARQERGKKIYALYQQDEQGKRQELIENINSFNVKLLGGYVEIKAIVNNYPVNFKIKLREP